jgi:hypothetical protein
MACGALALGPPDRMLRKSPLAAPKLHSKLLNMRHFQASTGVSSGGQNAYNLPGGKPGESTGLAYFDRHGLSCRKAPLARPGFVPTCCPSVM